jgi:hypothetical protein
MWRMESLALVTVMVSGIVIVATKVQNQFDIHHAHFSLISVEFQAASVLQVKKSSFHLPQLTVLLVTKLFLLDPDPALALIPDPDLVPDPDSH